MTFHEFIVSNVHARSALLIAGVLGLCGCATIGPQSITAGRGAYTEVINSTEDEQILNVLVRQRYDETFGMISVASITANSESWLNQQSQYDLWEAEKKRKQLNVRKLFAA